MSAEKRKLIPSYLIEKEGYVNESQDKDKVLYFKHQAGGFIEKQANRSPEGEQIFTSRNMSLEVKENFHDDFTIDVKYKGNLTLLRFNGDDKTSSRTTVTFNAGGIYFTRWRSTYRKTIRYPEGKPDADGFLNATLVRSGNQLFVYQYDRLQAIWTIGNAFDNLDVEMMIGSADIKRFALSSGVALPPELHNESIEKKTINRDTNLKLVNLRDDVYQTDSYSTRMIKNITSYGQWIIALYDDNFMEAFSRPRGVDKGTSISEMTYDHTTSKTTITLEDEQVFVFDAIVEPAIAKPIPEGLGVLSTEGVHKPLNIGDGIVKVNAPRGSNKVIIWSKGDLPLENVSYLTDPNKKIGPLDYSKRLTMRQISKPGHPMYPSLNPSTQTPRSDWLTLPYEVSTSNLDIFEIDSEGKVTLPKGEILIRGFFKRIYLDSHSYSFRITDGFEDIVSKSWVTTKDVDFRGESFFEFEERVFLFEEKTVHVEEIIYYLRSGYGVSNTNGTLVSRIEFFKL